MDSLNFSTAKDPFEESISPLWEVSAYEWLWREKNTSFKKIAEIFAKYPKSRPSDLVPRDQIRNFEKQLLLLFENRATSIGRPRLIIHNTLNYPKKLRDAEEPVEILYY